MVTSRYSRLLRCDPVRLPPIIRHYLFRIMSFLPQTIKDSLSIDQKALSKPHDKMPQKYRLTHPDDTQDGELKRLREKASHAHHPDVSDSEKYSRALHELGESMGSFSSLRAHTKRGGRIPMALFIGACVFLTSGVIAYGQYHASSQDQYSYYGNGSFEDPCYAYEDQSYYNGYNGSYGTGARDGGHYTDPRTGQQYYQNGQNGRYSNDGYYDDQYYDDQYYQNGRSQTDSRYMSDYRVETTHREVRAGEPVTARWSAPNGSSANTDWVGSYRAGDSDRQYKDWKYTNGQSQGTTIFVFTEPGTYEIRYYGSGYERRATSERIHVRDGSQTGSHTQRTGSSQQWDDRSGTYDDRYSDDRYSDDRYNGGDQYYDQYSDDRYTSDQRYDRFDPQTSGNGYYDARDTYSSDRRAYDDRQQQTRTTQQDQRYYQDDWQQQSHTSQQDQRHYQDDRQYGHAGSGGYEVRPSRTTVIVGETVHVNWVAPRDAKKQDWVGAYRAGASDRQYHDWHYTGGQSSGSAVFVFTQPGTYEIRYYTDNGYDRKAVSQRVHVRER
jgi:hypothetical protein